MAFKLQRHRITATAPIGRQYRVRQRLGAHYERYKGAGITTINSASLHYRNASKVIDAFDRGVLIRSKHGFYLAIPTEKAEKGASAISASLRWAGSGALDSA